MMPTFERRNQIVQLIVQEGYVQSAKLAKQFQVSMETIRKDLLYLEEKGIVEKSFGGARLLKEDREQSLDVRLQNIDKKRQLARIALQVLDDASIVFLDTGTSVQEVARLLYKVPSLTIVTNSLLVLDVLEGDQHEVFLTGGRRRAKNRSLIGNWSCEAIRSVHADVCFLGTSGLLDAEGPTAHSYHDLETKKHYISQSDRVYVLADSDKFKSGGVHTICPWSAIDAILTDSELPLNLYNKYRKKVPIIMAQEDRNE